MSHLIPALALIAGLTLTACSSELDDKTAATVEDAPAAQPDAPAAAPSTGGVPYAFDSGGSTLQFVGHKVTRDHQGSFGSFSGTAQVADGAVQSVTVEVDLSSVEADAERLTKHLKSPDFFDVGTYGTATFSSSEIAAGGDGGSHTVTGTLDFHGAQKQISFPATIHVMDGKVHVQAEFTIDRQQWGLSYPGKPDDLIKDEVLVRLDVNLAPKDA